MVVSYSVWDNFRVRLLSKCDALAADIDPQSISQVVAALLLQQSGLVRHHPQPSAYGLQKNQCLRGTCRCDETSRGETIGGGMETHLAQIDFARAYVSTHHSAMLARIDAYRGDAT